MSDYSLAGTHPGWCDPLRCHDTATDRQHCSELSPLRLRDDAQLTLAWVQADEFAVPGQSGVPELRIDVARGMPGRDTTLYLLPYEVQRLTRRLIGEYYRQVFLVRDTRVVA